MEDVAPLAGAWVETCKMRDSIRASSKSRPSRARGLKRYVGHDPAQVINVAPLAGAWVETAIDLICNADYCVAPLAGAWVET